MSLNKLYYIYGLDTSCFYTDEELALDKKLNKARSYRNKMKDIKDGKYAPAFLKRRLSNKEITRDEYNSAKQEWCNRRTDREQSRNKVIYKMFEGKEGYEFPEYIVSPKGRVRKADHSFKITRYITQKKHELVSLLSENLDTVVPRTVRQERIIDKDGTPKLSCRVSVFDSNLTRLLGMREREFNDQMFIVKVFYFEVANSLLRHGCVLNGEKYVFFSASAGQIRTKKFVAIKETLLNQQWNTLTAGLTIDSINEQGGMNINKYLAYLALCNSGTDLWADFDIDKTIVVDDWENNVKGVVDFIDYQTFEITREEKELPIAQMDGCGIMLPCISTKNFMVRLPWVKGLLASFDFRKFIEVTGSSPIVTDIYGQEHNIVEEDIQIIFTKSQFKMWKFFKDWNEYKTNFKLYNCTAGITNEEEDSADEFGGSVINYQMIQSLPDLTDDELKELGKKNVEIIDSLTTNKTAMLETFGVDDNKKDYQLNDFQKCLKLYPELLQDPYCKQTLKDLKDKLESDLWSARFKLDGKYTFVIPDLYAFCEWLFMKKEVPDGLLQNGQVSCRLFKIGEKIDCLRSPHLFCEHAIRNNVYNTWFNTNGIYISSHDYISRILQCDFDGDRLLLINHPTLVNAAKRNMVDKVPLYYEMKKAKAEPVTSESLWHGIRLAYTGGNIGEISNQITKIWNHKDVLSDKNREQALTCIKYLCMLTNFTIDYAKTLYKPTIPPHINSMLKAYNKDRVPAFFKYAKGKEDSCVCQSSNSPVDRLPRIFKKKRIKCAISDDVVGKFDYTMLMNNPTIEYNEKIGKAYQKYVSVNMKFNRRKEKSGDSDLSNYKAVYDQARTDIFAMFSEYSRSDIIDNIIAYLFNAKKSKNKKAFWQMFETEVYENLIENLETQIAICPTCGKRFRKTNSAKYCPSCRGYRPIATKTLTCIDCGKEFVVSSKNTKAKRCPECQRIIDREKTRLRVAKYRQDSM